MMSSFTRLIVVFSRRSTLSVRKFRMEPRGDLSDAHEVWKQSPGVNAVIRSDRCEVSCQKIKKIQTNLQLVYCFNQGST